MRSADIGGWREFGDQRKKVEQKEQEERSESLPSLSLSTPTHSLFSYSL